MNFYILTFISNQISRVFCRDSEGVEVIFVSDIMKKKPEEATWTFETLRTNIIEGELEIIKFDFMDMQVTFI